MFFICFSKIHHNCSIIFNSGDGDRQIKCSTVPECSLCYLDRISTVRIKASLSWKIAFLYGNNFLLQDQFFTRLYHSKRFSMFVLKSLGFMMAAIKCSLVKISPNSFCWNKIIQRIVKFCCIFSCFVFFFIMLKRNI